MIRSPRSTAYESLPSLEQDLAFDDVHKSILGLMADSEYTNLGYLLSDQCDYQIKAASFSEGRGSAFLDRQEISGSLLRQFEESMHFISRNMTVSSRIDGVYRKDSCDHPEEAVRETVHDAIVHRDYSSSGTTLISFFDDSIEVVSTEALIEDLTISNLEKRVSFSRNKRLSELFYRLGLVEAYGTDIPRIMRPYEKASKKPVFEASNSTFRVTLFKLSDDPLVGHGKSSSFTRAEYEKKTGLSRSKAIVELNRLVSERGLDT